MMSRQTTAALLAAALSGCAVLQPPALEQAPAPEVEAQPPETGVPVEAPPPAKVEGRALRSDVDQLLDYFQRVRRLSGTELGREQEGARRAFSRSGSDFDRVRLAMALSLPNAAAQDETRALELLEPVLKNRASNLNALAYLMSAYVQEQRRLGANAQAMQRKLDQLRSMERSLIERERTGKSRP